MLKEQIMAKGIVEQLDPIFKAKSMAVIGASNTPPKWGHRMVHSPLKTGYRGAIYPVNPKEKEISGLTCYPSIGDVPDNVDMAVIAVPAAAVPRAMAECVDKRVKGAVLITAGFAETGQEGKALQEEVVRIARQGGIRFVGPNGMGIYSSAISLNLCFHGVPLPGRIAFVSQSGTFGHSLAEVANMKGYGISKFISIGNQADLNAADYLEYLGEDEDTGAVTFYMEGIPDGRRFFEVAREVVKKKPVVIYKAGRTDAAARATITHTSSLAGSDEIFDAMCKQVGLIRTAEAAHPFEMAEALVSQPLPKGNRVAIVGSGGQGVVTSDSCETLGLKVPEFDDETKSRLKPELPPHAPAAVNPVDFAGALRTPLEEAKVADALARIDYIDGIIMNMPVFGFSAHAPGEMARIAIEGAEIMAAIPEKYGKPVITLRWAELGSNIVQDIVRSAHIPAYDTPEQCARAMYALVTYAQLRRDLGVE
jgi:acyl-CoA synthetase (NDP forming)